MMELRVEVNSREFVIHVSSWLMMKSYRLWHESVTHYAERTFFILVMQLWRNSQPQGDLTWVRDSWWSNQNSDEILWLMLKCAQSFFGWYYCDTALPQGDLIWVRDSWWSNQNSDESLWLIMKCAQIFLRWYHCDAALPRGDLIWVRDCDKVIQILMTVCQL